VRKLFIAAAIALAMPAAITVAQTPAVNAARSAGIVGERYDGYLGFASSPTAAVRSQVISINIRRRALYSDLAARRGVTPAEVGITAGCQLLARVGVGEAYLLADGMWRRRMPGQPAPVPDYCR
jgi:uncharacterized protein YdbL (DUF1318 family)